MNGGMSAIGTKQTCDSDQLMSVFERKADIAKSVPPVDRLGVR
jgi:hypothetical protein